MDTIHVVGTFLIQAEGAFLNGAGTEGEGERAVTKPKLMSVLGNRFDGSFGQIKIPYVSSQAWKRWLRDTFAQENPQETPAIMLTTKINPAGNTIKTGIEPDPVKLAEADIFGFMKTEGGQGKIKQENSEEDSSEEDDGESEETQEMEEKKAKGKSKVKPAIRTSPFQASILKPIWHMGSDSQDQAYAHPQAVAFTAIEHILSDIIKQDKKEAAAKKKTREETTAKIQSILSQAKQTMSTYSVIDNAIPHIIDELSNWKDVPADYKSKVEEAIKQIQSATNSSLGYKTQFYNAQLQGVLGLAYCRLGVFRNEGDRIELEQTLVANYLKEKKIEAHPDFPGREIYRMVANPRKVRATKILRSLAVMRGGAKQAQFATPVHPQVLILAGLNSGNLIFNNIFEDSINGPKIKIKTLQEVLNDYTSRLVSNVYIGIRTGYLEPENEKKLREWAMPTNENNESFPREFKHKKTENGKEQEVSWKVEICTPLEAADKMAKDLPL